MKILGTLQSCQIVENDDRTVSWTHGANIDNDGIQEPGDPIPENVDHDPYHQGDTSLHYQGRPLDPQIVPYIVVPPLVIHGVRGIVMGCHATVTNQTNGKTTQAVVGDIGPRTKIGELSCECARRLGLSGNSNTGGTDDHIIHYQIWPGVPAIVDGRTYTLQAALP